MLFSCFPSAAHPGLAASASAPCTCTCISPLPCPRQFTPLKGTQNRRDNATRTGASDPQSCVLRLLGSSLPCQAPPVCSNRSSIPSHVKTPAALACRLCCTLDRSPAATAADVTAPLPATAIGSAPFRCTPQNPAHPSFSDTLGHCVLELPLWKLRCPYTSRSMQQGGRPSPTLYNSGPQS